VSSRVGIGNPIQSRFGAWCSGHPITAPFFHRWSVCLCWPSFRARVGSPTREPHTRRGWNDTDPV
jgi:hypothetical protein